VLFGTALLEAFVRSWCSGRASPQRRPHGKTSSHSSLGFRHFSLRTS
jgi:hypothetical protein